MNNLKKIIKVIFIDSNQT